MPDPRESILGRVNGALAPLPSRTPLPDYDAEIAVVRKLLDGRDLLGLFSERMKLVNGETFTTPAEVVGRLRSAGWKHGICDPEIWPKLEAHFGPDFQIETVLDRARIDDYAFGITKAAGAIAETGTIILKDASTSSRLAALAPWVHVAVLYRKDIHPDIPHAVDALGDDPNVIWCTGPSKTADVEGILIEGVHGPGAQIALVLD